MKFAAPVLAAAVAALAFAASAQTPPAPPSLAIKPVKPGLYMITGAGGTWWSARARPA